MTPKLLLLALALARPAAAQTIDHETWSVIGWDDACGVAYQHLSYPTLGEAIVGEPISTRIGTASIPVGSEKEQDNWALEADGPNTWDENAAAKTVQELKGAGYTRPGFPETLPDVAPGAQPGLKEILLSTSTLSARTKTGWPGKEWRWAAAGYNPLATCALLVYEKRASPRHYRMILVRVYNPRARRDRAYAHASNARLLFDAGNLDAAAPEAANAAALDPDLPVARYAHAAMLALTGDADQAVAELTAAVKIDPRLAAKARGDIDFDALKDRQDFSDLTRH